MIVDGHIYLNTPVEELDAYRKYLKAHGRQKGWDSVDDLLRDMDKDGVDFGVILHGSNTRRIDAINNHPDRLAAFAGVRIREMAQDRDGTLSRLRKQIEDGCVGIGLRHRCGYSTDELAIVVSVTKKVPREHLDPNDLVPHELEGIPVDVQEVGPLRAH